MAKRIPAKGCVRVKDLRKALEGVPDSAYVSLFVDGPDAREWLVSGVSVVSGTAHDGTHGWIPYFEENDAGRSKCVALSAL